jgi:hypothetical protein
VLSGSNLAQISADIAEEEDVFPSAEPINRITLYRRIGCTFMRASERHSHSSGP